MILNDLYLFFPIHRIISFEVREQTGSLDFKFDHQKVVDLKTAVENFLAREVEFLVVTNSDRFDGSAGHGYHIEFF